MCLYPKLLKNPKYKANKKNGGIIPHMEDRRVAYVPIACQKCMECRKAKSREWQTRLSEDIKEHTGGIMVTLTLNDESLKELQLGINEKLEGYDIDNAIITKANRYFTERWRAKHLKSPRHWLVSELGHNGTERIHLHGIIWPNIQLSEKPREQYIQVRDEIRKIWGYGFVWTGSYVSLRTVNYIVKYISKQDHKHPNYKGVILTSNGIGKHYLKSPSVKLNHYNHDKTNDNYKTAKGNKTSLPIYYRNNIYTDEQKEQLWLQKLDKQTRYVCGERVDVSTEQGKQEYQKLLKWHQERNKKLGYGTDEINWEQHEYEKQLRNLKKQERLKPK